MTFACFLLCFLARLPLVTKQKPRLYHRPDLQSQVVGQWTMTTAIYNSTQYGVTNVDTIPFTSADYCDFKADSTLSIMASGVAYNGNWVIDSSKLYITGTNYLDNPSGYQLPIPLIRTICNCYYLSSIPNISLEEKPESYQITQG